MLLITSDYLHQFGMSQVHVPVEQPKPAQRSTVEKGMSFLVLRSAAILVHLSKVVRVTGYVLDESGHFDKSGIIRQFHRELLLTGPVSL